jgi:hypothetical protein
MKDTSTSQLIHRLAASVLLALILILPACGRDQPPALVPEADIPATLQTAFQGASDETRQLATQAIAAVERGDLPRAFVLLQSLVGQVDLSREQRELATGSMLAVSARLQERAGSGDRRATELLELHQSHK